VNPRALRWTSIAEEMVSQGTEVHMVCSKVSGERAYEVIKGVHIHRVGMRSQHKPGQSNPVAVKPNIIKSALKFLYNKIVKYLIWPDSNMFWISSATKKTKQLIEQEKIEKMISVSHPFSGHVVGHKVYKAFKDIKWVTDIGDPFAFLEFVNINNKVLYKSFNFTYEKKIIKESLKQTVTTPLTTDEYIKYGFDCKTSMVVIPPLLKNEVSLSVSPQEKSNIVKWIFVGTLYKKIRSPKYLLELFMAVDQLDNEKNHELHFYGETKMCAHDFDKYNNILNKKIFLHGLVRPEEIASKLKTSDVLVNIGNKTSYQLPSKLVEYMALGKKILNIKSIENDSSEEFLKNYSLAVLVDESKSIKVEAIAALGKINQKLDINVSKISEVLKPYTAGSIARSYLSLFK